MLANEKSRQIFALCPGGQRRNVSAVRLPSSARRLKATLRAHTGKVHASIGAERGLKTSRIAGGIESGTADAGQKRGPVCCGSQNVEEDRDSARIRTRSL